MSATSRVGRCTSAASSRRHGLQRTDHLTQQVGGYVGVDRCGLQLLVPQQYLDHADIDLALEQMRGKAVAQGVCVLTRLWIPAASAAA